MSTVLYPLTSLAPPRLKAMSLTAHQRQVLEIVIKGNDSADTTLQLADMDEVLERVTKTTTKQAMQFTIRALVQSGMIEKGERVTRRGRMRATYKATDIGLQMTGSGSPGPAFVAPVDDFDPEEFLSRKGP